MKEIRVAAEERERGLALELRMGNLGIEFKRGFRDKGVGFEGNMREKDRERDGSWREMADMALLCLSSIAYRRSVDRNTEGLTACFSGRLGCI